MITALALINVLIFIFLGALHIYWMIGGKWGLEESLPTNSFGGELLISPGRISCFIVASGLFVFALLNLSIGLGLSLKLPFELEIWGIWLVGVIFLARAIGDFHYVGMFKKLTNTKFGKMDTKWYIPLCLYLGISSLWLGWSTL